MGSQQNLMGGGNNLELGLGRAGAGTEGLGQGLAWGSGRTGRVGWDGVRRLFGRARGPGSPQGPHGPWQVEPVPPHLLAVDLGMENPKYCLDPGERLAAVAT